MYNFRTDLAVERNEIYKRKNSLEKIEGIEVQETEENNTKITRVLVTNENGEKAIGKPIGTYTTIDIDKMKGIDDNRIEDISNIVANELKNIISKHVSDIEDILIVGLGNIYVTPDALGPKVVPEIEVTRHILQYMPNLMPADTRPVSAIAPGVLGITGIETVEVVTGVVQNVKPKLLIVIDALAAKNVNRISSSIQISDTGIVPGGGVENARKEITEKTLGIPVIAIGIPTVVDLASITNDCINIFIGNLQQKAESNETLNKLKDSDNYEKIKEALNVGEYNMIVTPKEIDELIENMKTIISKAINIAM